MSSPAAADVAIRPWPAPKKEKLEAADLNAQLSQLTSERKLHLRYITEASLLEEVEHGQRVDGHAGVMEGIEAPGGGKKDTASDRDERLQQLHQARDTMYRQVEWSAHHAAGMLDLIALVLSKDPKKTVDNSYSQKYKANSAGLPRAWLAVSKTAEAPKNELELQRQRYDDERTRLAGEGSRMRALDWATDKILDAATRLETDVRKEVKYWDQVLAISDKGWPLQRLRKGAERSPLAVRYGFRGASDHYKARGVAPLKMDDVGRIILDPKFALKPKTLRVRVSDDGRIIGTSRLALHPEGTDSDLEKTVKRARDSLFEEEIFHEISMEARQLLSYGIHVSNSVVQLETSFSGRTSTRRNILIDCVPLEDDYSSSGDQSCEWLARNVAEGLRLMLTHEHRMRLFRRSQIPPPSALNRRQNQSPPLLRTLLAIFSHLSCVDALEEHLQGLVKSLESAGLRTSLHMSREMSWENVTKTITESPRKDLSLFDQILELFVKPLDGAATLTLPSSCAEPNPETLTIAVRTSFGPPTFGTGYKVTLSPSLAGVLDVTQSQWRDSRFASLDETTTYVDWLFSLDLSHTLLKNHYGQRAALRSKNPRVTISVRDGKKTVKKDVAVSVANGTLTVAVGPAPLPEVIHGPVQSFSWAGGEGQSSLLEKVEEFL
jgi:mediator of RNA polymerase II transcription subunit 17